MAKTADPGSEPPSELSLCRLCHAGEHAEAGCGSVKKELGLNAVRTSHYPQSHYFLERCDELGLLVFTEFPGWQHIGDDTWKAQAVANAEDMIRQYRNHPSIILWGIRINESPDDDAFYEKTNAVAHKLDPSRPTGGVRAMKKVIC